MNINKKVSIVTGAGSGIGAAVCRELATRGAGTVVLVDRSDSVYEFGRFDQQFRRSTSR